MPVLAEHDLKSQLKKNKVNFVCKNCGQALTAFLRDMAKHNTKVVCPRCGQEQDPADVTKLSKNLGAQRGKPLK
jgi:predicted RNA-binding Zn-ribbon protein involved in translation (DUF1610 family)